LPDELSGIKTIVCPNCKTAVPVEELRQNTVALAGETLPIFVDGTPMGPRGVPPGPEPVAPRVVPPPAPELVVPRVVPPPAPEPVAYTGDYMKDEAARFTQYVTARLNELQKRRHDLAEAEHRFESMTMERKQELFRAQGALVVETERLREREAAIQAKEAALAAREAELVARANDIPAREARLARVEARALDADQRIAELRATIDQLDATRTALAQERAELSRSAEALASRAEALDKAELALHRRFAELDEMVSGVG
jgi:hypothetical protein